MTCGGSKHENKNSSNISEGVKETNGRLEEIVAEVTATSEISESGVEVFRDADRLRHREGDLPAVVAPDGTQVWFNHGDWAQRPDGQPNTVRGDGTLEWHAPDGKLLYAEYPDGTCLTAAEELSEDTVVGSFGDSAVGKGYSDRITRVLPDGVYETTTTSFYVEGAGSNYETSYGRPPFRVMQQTEIVQHTDPNDVGGTEIYSDYAYEEVTSGEKTIAGAEAYAQTWAQDHTGRLLYKQNAAAESRALDGMYREWQSTPSDKRGLGSGQEHFIDRVAKHYNATPEQIDEAYGALSSAISTDTERQSLGSIGYQEHGYDDTSELVDEVSDALAGLGMPAKEASKFASNLFFDEPR